MYCTTCGKQIIDTARFCNYCGAPVAGAVPAAPAAPVNFGAPVSAPVNSAAPVSTPVESSPVSAQAESSPVSAPIPENLQSDILFENKETVIENDTDLTSGYSQIPGEEVISTEPQTADNEILQENSQNAKYVEALSPVPNVETPSAPGPVLNTAVGDAHSLPAPSQIPMSGEGGVYPAVPEKPAKPLPERKYTLGHIMMCLAAVAIMAIVAGVFAGLYFSVV